MSDQLHHHRRAGDVVPKGPRIRLFSALPVALACIALVSLLITAQRLNQAQNQLTVSEKRYVSAQVAANELKNASDDQTTQARMFALTGDWTYLRRYFDENVQIRRRELSMEALSRTLSGTDAESTLQVALDYSNTLMHREYESMLLVIAAQGYDAGKYAPQLSVCTLTEEQLALTPAEQMAAALELVTNGDYQFYDGMIDTDVNNCIGFMAKEQNQVEKMLTTKIHQLIVIQQVFLVLLAGMIALSAHLNLYLIVRPLKKDVEQISRQEDLPMKGAYELQYLAQAYNRMLAENRANNDRLTYEAEHDALTGLFNRGAFDKLRCKLEHSAIALIHVDVDHFKEINDTWGHDIGDQALRKVADALHRSFRRSDFPCRTGGDEFAVIVTNVNSAHRDVVTRKLEQVRSLLLDTSDGLPRITLSIGAVFSDTPHGTGDLYKDADAALYVVKEDGRDGLAFFDGADTRAIHWTQPS